MNLSRNTIAEINALNEAAQQRGPASLVAERDLVNLDAYIATPPAKPKRVTRRTREALAAEYQRGFDDGVESRDDGSALMALFVVAAITGVSFFSLGAWLF